MMLTEIPECNDDEVTVFNIIKSYPSWCYFPGAQWRHSDGFALVYPGDNEHQMLQAFSFETLGKRAMEKWMEGVDIGGYFFHVYKSHPTPLIAGLLEGKITKLIGDADQNSSNNRISLGFGHHSSRYEPYAHTEALHYTHLECDGTACEIARKKQLPLIEILDDYLILELSRTSRDYGKIPLYESMDLLVKSLEPRFKRKEVEQNKEE